MNNTFIDKVTEKVIENRMDLLEFKKGLPFYDGSKFVENNYIDVSKEKLLKIVKDVITETIDYISFGEGWEETRDFYAEKLGLTVKYKK